MEDFLSVQAVSEVPVQVLNHRVLSLPGLTFPLYCLTFRAPGHIWNGKTCHHPSPYPKGSHCSCLRTKMSRSEVNACLLAAFLERECLWRVSTAPILPHQNTSLPQGHLRLHFRNWVLLDCLVSCQGFALTVICCFMTIWLLITNKKNPKPCLDGMQLFPFLGCFDPNVVFLCVPPIRKQFIFFPSWFRFLSFSSFHLFHHLRVRLCCSSIPVPSKAAPPCEVKRSSCAQVFIATPQWSSCRHPIYQV